MLPEKLSWDRMSKMLGDMSKEIVSRQNRQCDRGMGKPIKKFPYDFGQELLYRFEVKSE